MRWMALLGVLAAGCIPLPDPLESMPAPEAGAPDAASFDGAAPDLGEARPDLGDRPDLAEAEPDAAPVIEVCNQVDDDGDGRVDEGLLNACGDCGPPLDEACDGVDQDCDFIVDEGAGCPCPAGTTEPCGVDVGECTVGLRACMGDDGWGACDGLRPVGEFCNGLDDDCDGTIDGAEGEAPYAVCACAPDEVEPCGSDVGACAAGSRGCVAGEWGPCEGAVEPSDEVCDGVDDDCDGTTDEGACVCEVGSSRPCGSDTGRCAAGSEQCGYEGWGPCEGATGPRDEVCDGADDDCDGTTDEGACVCDPGSTRPCGPTTGRCAAGTETCGFAGWGACMGATGPRAERCDGVDDDCDGAVDEDTCVCDVGATRGCGPNVGRCAPGTETCGFDGWGPCEGAVGPRSELCDGVDDDCDGRTDESPMLPADCQTPLCARARPACVQGQVVCQPDPIAEACNGADDDCDGTADEGIGGGACQTGESGLCATGVRRCDPASGAVVCRSNHTPRNESCDGRDEDCDGRVDEGLPTRADCLRPGDDYCVNGSLRPCLIIADPEPGPDPEPIPQ